MGQDTLWIAGQIAILVPAGCSLVTTSLGGLRCSKGPSIRSPGPASGITLLLLAPIWFWGSLIAVRGLVGFYDSQVQEQRAFGFGLLFFFIAAAAHVPCCFASGVILFRTIPKKRYAVPASLVCFSGLIWLGWIVFAV